MSISFYGYILAEQDGQPIWNWPETMTGRLESITPDDLPNPHYDPRIDINLNNRNAALLLNELGFLSNGDLWNAEPMPIDVFEAGVLATIARNPEPIPGLVGYDTEGQPGVRVVSGGVPDGYINARLAQLVLLVEAAREYGATHISWG